MVKPLSKHRKISLILVLLAGLVLMGQAGGGTTIYLPFITKTTPPLAATSYYIQDDDPGRLYDLGCELGTRDAARLGKQDNLVILDFGQMWVDNGVYGALGFEDPFVNDLWHFMSFADLETLAKHFAIGYWACSENDDESHLTLGVGTNSFGFFNQTNRDRDNMRFLAGDFGRNWANMIYNLNYWAQNGFISQVTFTGAIDIEWSGQANNDGYYLWQSAYVVRGWIDEFDKNDRNSEIYINYGACVGCYTYLDPGWKYISTDYWTIDDVWFVSWGSPPAFSVPEIYDNSNDDEDVVDEPTLAKQWSVISQYGSLYKGSRIVFSGVMTQWGACQQRGGSDPTCATLDNTPEEGWYQLVNALIAINDPTPYPRWSTDIRWQIK